MRTLLSCICTICCILFITPFTRAQSWQWVKTTTGADVTIGRCILTDAAGYVYVAGTFGLSATFGTTTVTYTGTGMGWHIFLAKYDAAGNVLWATSFPGTGNEVVKGITMDAAGYLYLTGNFTATLTFGSTTLTNSAGCCGDNIFLAKLDASGNAIWARRAGDGTYNNDLFKVITDSGCNVYTAGYYNSPSINLGSGITVTGACGALITKYDSSGNTVWARTPSGTARARYHSIAIDRESNLYVAGNIGSPGTLTYGPTTLTSTGSLDVLLVKYDTTGNVLWATSAGGTGEDSASSVATDTMGNVFIAGVFRNTITFGSTTHTNSAPTTCDIFVAKYSSSGSVLWSASAAGASSEDVRDIVTDDTGNVYVAGTFTSSSVTFGATAISISPAVGSANDLYIAKYTPSGAVALATSAGGVGNQLAFAVALYGNANIYITGTYANGAGVFGTTTLPYTPNAKYLIAKYSAMPLAAITGDTFLCVDETSILMDAATGGTWNSSNTAVATVGLSSGIVLGIAPGTAIITYTTLGGPAATVVTINPLPAVFAIGGSGTYAFTGYVTLSGSETGTAYQLYNTASAIGTPIAGTGAALSFPVTVTNIYFIVATSALGCTDTMTGTADMVIAIHQGFSNMKGYNDINTWPNPATNTLFVEAPMIETVQLTDITGRLLQNIHCDVKKLSINLAGYSPGVYLLRINNAYVERIVKE